MARSGGRPPVVRVLLVLFAVGTVGWALSLDQEPDAFARIRSFSTKVKRRAMEAAASSLADEQAAETRARLAGRPDLLLHHGSWSASEPVRHVFGLPTPAAPSSDTQLAAARTMPIAHTADPGPLAVAAPSTEEPAADDAPSADELPTPVEHHVTLVMLGDDVSRAVIDAALVGLGDRIAAGVLVQIHAHGVVVRGEHGLVAYDVGNRVGRRMADEDLDGSGGARGGRR